MPRDSLASFFERLRNVCADHSACHGEDRTDRIRAQAEQSVALAAELGILKRPEITWPEFIGQISGDFKIGSEHVVDLSDEFKLVGKTTKPPHFGLVPEVRKLPVVENLRHPETSSFREVIEFFPATPLEYLSRWLASNEVFTDEVRLVSVIQWSDGLISLGITQPQYHGTPAEPREIEEYFKREGWSLLNDPSGHAVFYNYAFGIMAIDAEKRNCYITKYGLQPFDVILCVPDENLERFLKIYPE